MATLDLNTHYLFLVRAEFGDPEREAEWNRWYDEEHVPAMLSVPGIVSCTRYQELGADGKYLAVYEINDPQVFDAPRYAEVQRWHKWRAYIKEWRRAVFELTEERPVT